VGKKNGTYENKQKTLESSVAGLCGSQKDLATLISGKAQL